MKKLFLVMSLLFGFSLADAKVNIIVSIAPQKAYVDEIGGDLVNTTLLAPIGTNPNLYEPKASQMLQVSKADIYLTIGGHFEKAWLPKIQNQNQDMEIFNCTSGIKRIAMKFRKVGAKDVHVWTIPKNIEKIGKNIYDILVKHDSANEKYYKKNYLSFVKKAQQTDKKIRKILKNVPNGTLFMVYHPAWGYFAKEYNLEQLAIEIEGKEPKPRILQGIIKKAKEHNVKLILTQPEFSKKGANVIANELNIDVVEISPIDPDWSNNLIKLATSIALGSVSL